jgi:hypothetical protein
MWEIVFVLLWVIEEECGTLQIQPIVKMSLLHSYEHLIQEKELKQQQR